MNTNTTELSMEEMALANGGFDWLDHIGGAAIGMLTCATAGGFIGAVGGPVGIATGVVGGLAFGAVVGGSMGYEVAKEKIREAREAIEDIF